MGSYQSWGLKNSKTKRFFFFFNNSLGDKPDLKWREAIYCLYFSHSVWKVCYRKINGFDYRALYQIPLGVLQNIQYMYPSSFLKSKNIPSSQIHLTPRALEDGLWTCIYYFQGTAVITPIIPHQPKGTENWCLPITKCLSLSKKKKINRGCFQERAKK